jgi:hypothetical protein
MTREHRDTCDGVCGPGVVTMSPIGPVSPICIRRALAYTRHAGIVAGGAGVFAAVTYVTIGAPVSIVSIVSLAKSAT